MPKLEYDDKRLLIFLSGFLILGLVLGFTFGFLLPPSQSKINNQALIQNFNERHNKLLDTWEFQEYSDIDKVNYISGYKQGVNDEINRYNWKVDSLKYTGKLQGK